MKTGLLVDMVDNVAVVTSNLIKGEEVKVKDIIIVANERIPVGHKIAIKDIDENIYVYKYGVPIGISNREILRGDHVHIQNVTDITEELCNGYINKFIKEGQKNE